jgi:D-tyrosyl-tRNA(Tyr) deacylase
MRALLQRVSEASVSLEGEVLAAIGPGLVVLVCAEKGDDEAQAGFFARKIANMRLFADAGGKTNLAILDVGGEALVISQFTLAADWRRGNRPGFSAAADPETAERLYEYLCKQLAAEGVPVKTGRFRSHMAVSLVNDGPMTIWMDSGGR